MPSALATTTAAVDAVLRDRGLRRLSDDQLAAARMAAARGNAALTPDAARWVGGALRLSAELDPLAALIRVAPAQAIARAHVLLARGLVPDEQLGRVSAGPAAAARVSGASELLTGTTSASALVLGAIVHAEIAVVEPFGEASGLVARAVEQLVLMSAGLDPAGVIAVPAGHAQNPPAYVAALAGYVNGGLGGVKAWILHCCSAVARGAEQLAVVNSRQP